MLAALASSLTRAYSRARCFHLESLRLPMTCFYLRTTREEDLVIYSGCRLNYAVTYVMKAVRVVLRVTAVIDQIPAITGKGKGSYSIGETTR